MKRPINSNPNSGNRFQSYQKGGGFSASGAPVGTGYQPPVFYAESQTRTIEDTTKNFYQADETAGNVLNQLTSQRHQILGAHDNVSRMRETTDKAKKEMEELRQKYRQKKQRLYMWIALLGVIDTLLFLRILQCHGNFYCF
jgi:hypothetical protein